MPLPFRRRPPNGGKRRGAGRKPAAATILRRRLIENKIEEAEASFAFLVAVRTLKLFTRDQARELWDGDLSFVSVWAYLIQFRRITPIRKGSGKHGYVWAAVARKRKPPHVHAGGL